jgi:hypothetical protein
MDAAIIDAVVDRGREGDGRVPADLVDRAIRGDRGAFDRLVEPHLVVALGAARLITGDEEDAADAVQERSAGRLAVARGACAIRSSSRPGSAGS